MKKTLGFLLSITILLAGFAGHAQDTRDKEKHKEKKELKDKAHFKKNKATKKHYKANLEKRKNKRRF